MLYELQQETPSEAKDTTVICGFERYTITRAGVIFDTSTQEYISVFPHDAGKGKSYMRVNLHPGSGGKKKSVLLHRLLATAFITNPEKLPQVDHRNSDSLDNRLENLRWVSVCQNKQNRKPRNSSGLMGITPSATAGKWRAQIAVSGKVHALGTYSHPLDAAIAYDEAALAVGYLHHNCLIRPKTT